MCVVQSSWPFVADVLPEILIADELPVHRQQAGDMRVNVVTTESAAFVLDATIVVIPVYPCGGCVRWLRFSPTMYVFCGSCHPLHCSYTMWHDSNTGRFTAASFAHFPDDLVD